MVWLVRRFVFTFACTLPLMELLAREDVVMLLMILLVPESLPRLMYALSPSPSPFAESSLLPPPPPPPPPPLLLLVALRFPPLPLTLLLTLLPLALALVL